MTHRRVFGSPAANRSEVSAGNREVDCCEGAEGRPARASLCVQRLKGVRRRRRRRAAVP